MRTKIVVIAALLIAAAGGAAYYVMSNPVSAIQAAIEKSGAAATGTDMRIETTAFSAESGEVALSGVHVQNPAGFISGDALLFGTVTANVAVESLKGDGPIEVRDLVIGQTRIAYERRDGGSNLAALLTHAASATSAPNTKLPKSRKIVIDNLYMRDNQLTLVDGATQNTSIEARVPTIHLSNIGKATGGATPSEAAQLILAEIDKAALTAAAQTTK